MYKILLIIDMQNDFIDGVLGTKEAKAIVPKVVNKINEGWDAIVYTLDTHDEQTYEFTNEGKYIPKHCIKDTEGHKLHKEIDVALKNVSKKTTIKKHMKDKFASPYVTKFVEAVAIVGGPGYVGIHPLTEITVVGLCTDICVISNVMNLICNLKVPIKVDAKCCAGTTPENHRKALDIMKQCLIEVEE